MSGYFQSNNSNYAFKDLLKRVIIFATFSTDGCLAQVRVVIRAPQTSIITLLTKLVGNVDLKTNNLAKRRILVVWTGPGRVVADGYIAVFKM